jgi:RNA polymerase sigma-70 factor (ECF subfamily)
LAQPRSYLFQIASNLIVDSYRKRRHREQRLAEDVDFDDAHGARMDHRQAEDAMMRASFVRIQLRDMPEQRRAVYVMHQIEGRTCNEIAERLDISPRTVNRMMNRATEDLGMQ